MNRGKLKQKNVRIYENQQRMIDVLLDFHNKGMMEQGYEPVTESEFIRFMITDYYVTMRKINKELPSEWEI
jgi:hypothetical protein